jgi:hypothetical protein
MFSFSSKNDKDSLFHNDMPSPHIGVGLTISTIVEESSVYQTKDNQPYKTEELDTEEEEEIMNYEP